MENLELTIPVNVTIEIDQHGRWSVTEINGSELSYATGQDMTEALQDLLAEEAHDYHWARLQERKGKVVL